MCASHHSSHDRDAVRLGAEETVRDLGTLHLAGWVDALAHQVQDPLDPVDQYLAATRLAVARQELDQRTARAPHGEAVMSPNHPTWSAWRDLARAIRERCDPVWVLDWAGYPLHDLNEREGHAPCPVCGGTDRLVVFRTPPGRAWCRQCRYSADAIALAASLLPDCDGSFLQTVASLGRSLGFGVPDEQHLARTVLAATELEQPDAGRRRLRVREVRRARA